MGCKYIVRYIGSKRNLLDEVEGLFDEKINDESNVLLDLFSGTGIVAYHFKNRYRVIANDMLYCSYAMVKGGVTINKHPPFRGLKKMGIDDPIEYLNTIEKSTKGFIAKHYTPLNKTYKRMYVSIDNAVFIDSVRIKINEWYSIDAINESEFYYLLNILLQAVPNVSNITGTYGAYLKYWDKRALNEIKLTPPILLNNSQKNRAVNVDANTLAKNVKADITYIDPPYNSRQYTSNYHLLETIAKYDEPKIHGVTGIREYASNEKSKYSSKRYVAREFEDLFSKLKTRHIFISYSSDGLLTKEEIITILSKYVDPSTIDSKVLNYRRYKSKVIKRDDVSEYLIYGRKDGYHIGSKKNSPKKAKVSLSEVTSNEFIASPLNYIGGKFKLLKQIVPLLPSKINNFYDVFCGGLNVGANIKANSLFANDLNDRVIGVLTLIKEVPIDNLLLKIRKLIDEYELSTANKEGFIKLRRDYNKEPSPLKLYVLICYSFNYQFRFNNNLEYNNPFGKNRSHFSEVLKTKLVQFNYRLKNMTIYFSSVEFQEIFRQAKFERGDVVYCDPPYLVTTGSYNDGNRGFKDWNEKQEYELLNSLDKLNEKNIRFALSNVLEHKGSKNKILIDWASKYNVHYLNYSYKNSSYNTKRAASTEVLITNY